MMGGLTKLLAGTAGTDGEVEHGKSEPSCDDMAPIGIDADELSVAPALDSVKGGESIPSLSLSLIIVTDEGTCAIILTQLTNILSPPIVFDEENRRCTGDRWPDNNSEETVPTASSLSRIRGQRSVISPPREKGRQRKKCAYSYYSLKWWDQMQSRGKQ